MHPSWELSAHALTQQAVQAAEEGQWNVVDACYRQRAELFRTNEVSDSLAGCLSDLDKYVHEKLRLAAMTVQHLLAEIASKRRYLERFDADVVEMSSHRVNRLV